jgi:hypothetical protein
MIKHACSMAGAIACLLLAAGAAFALPLAKPEANKPEASLSVTLAGHRGAPGGFSGFSGHHGGGPGFALKGIGPRGPGFAFKGPHGSPGQHFHPGHGGFPGYAHRHHGHRFYPYGYGFLPYYYYDYGYYDDCAWLRRRAIATGSPYWWRRYEACIYYD